MHWSIRTTNSGLAPSLHMTSPKVFPNDASDSEGSEFVDKENEMDEVDVDMTDFIDHVIPGRSDDDLSDIEGAYNGHDSEEDFDADSYKGIESDEELNADTHLGDGNEDLLDEDNMSYESFDCLTDSSMDDFETRRSRKLRSLRRKKQATSSIEDVTFFVGQTFGNFKDIRDLVRRHSI
ncbi:hypothetical protein R6Q59_029967 [Mikania micrantha]